MGMPGSKERLLQVVGRRLAGMNTEEEGAAIGDGDNGEEYDTGGDCVAGGSGRCQFSVRVVDSLGAPPNSC
jgi:hypothetical protein